MDGPCLPGSRGRSPHAFRRPAPGSQRERTTGPPSCLPDHLRLRPDRSRHPALLTPWRHVAEPTNSGQPLRRNRRTCSKASMATTGAGGSGTGLSDALTILGAAGIVIPAFARLKISPVIGFILVGIIAGPYALGSLAPAHPWLQTISISDPHAIEPFAELGIILLLFSAGLHISFRRLRSMRRAVFGVGTAELIGCAVLIGGGLLLTGTSVQVAAALGLALALSSTALVLPISGVDSPVGKVAFAMLLLEDLALVPMIFAIELIGGHGDMSGLVRTAILGILVVIAML